jgi:betaine reductase
MDLKSKKIIILGDRDGVPGDAIKTCMESVGAEVVFATTECFV